MKATIHFKLLLILFLLIISYPISGQNIESTDTIHKQILDAAREIMTSTATCALISLDARGRPRVRAMDPFKPENDFTVWFGTNSNSRKVQQIKNDPRVTLYYLANGHSGYVMIYGLAELVNNSEEKAKRWKDEWNAFYQNQRENYLLIKVTPEWMEVVSYSHGIVGDTVTWQPPIINFNKKK